jgi:hypothetical protein
MSMFSSKMVSHRSQHCVLTAVRCVSFFPVPQSGGKWQGRLGTLGFLLGTVHKCVCSDFQKTPLLGKELRNMGWRGSCGAGAEMERSRKSILAEWEKVGESRVKFMKVQEQERLGQGLLHMRMPMWLHSPCFPTTSCPHRLFLNLPMVADVESQIRHPCLETG